MPKLVLNAKKKKIVNVYEACPPGNDNDIILNVL